MSPLSIIALGGAMLLLAISPGPGVFATVSSALASGFRRASFVVMGIVIGDLIFLLFAIFGLSTLADTLGELFVIIKYAGGIYLLYIGYNIWTSTPSNMELQKGEDISWYSSLLSGLAITLGNPKVILFYLGFLPTFIDLSRLEIFDIIIIAVVVSIVLGSVMLTYAYMASKITSVLASTKSIEIINKTAGAVMMTTGGVLIARA